MAGQSESVLIKSLLNDRLTKMVKHEGLDLLLEFSAIIFDSGFALSGDSFGMCEVSDYAIADMTNAAKVVMMAADPVYMSLHTASTTSRTISTACSLTAMSIASFRRGNVRSSSRTWL